MEGHHKGRQGAGGEMEGHHKGRQGAGERDGGPSIIIIKEDNEQG